MSRKYGGEKWKKPGGTGSVFYLLTTSEWFNLYMTLNVDIINGLQRIPLYLFKLASSKLLQEGCDRPGGMVG